MSYQDYSSHWVLDQFLTYLEANVLGSNDEHLYDTLAVEHNINTVTIDGTHKPFSGSAVLTTIVTNTSYIIPNSTTWTPAAGIYQFKIDPYGIPVYAYRVDFYMVGAWRTTSIVEGLLFFDGTNMRIVNTGAYTSVIYYQKF